MTKRELARTIAEDLGVSHGLVVEAVQLTLDGIIEVLATEGRIELRNFGVFTVRRRMPRIARNPRTGEKVSLPERFAVKFKPGLAMQRRIEKSTVAMNQVAADQRGSA
jgi:nucleoid DNA-binding protein